ncbi:chymotrypsin-2-like [Melitaea cinxia]|uniref:chymotrypsin-2-like n=1 Tax=Melitaea cinxia TaxID=113334 RepID=UPI001E273C2A|nr:chymotrypsin-2-like [Melitaea cinxia]
MLLKAGLLVVTLLVGTNALPTPQRDLSFLFAHSENSRIVGGTNAGPTPYMVAIVTGVTVSNLICGGSLVTSRHIMTAAHCNLAVTNQDGSLLNSLRVTVGSNRWNRGGSTYRIQRSIVHPNYNHNAIKNDIGFLVTTANVALSNTVSLVPLNFDFVGSGVPARVTGWGRTMNGGSLSSTLRQLETTVIDGNQCRTRVAQRAQELNIQNFPVVDPNLEICTFHSNGRGTCNRDSGGPLMRTDRNQQVGLVSWGLPCARNAPDMFVRLSAYRAFVEQSIR